MRLLSSSLICAFALTLSGCGNNSTSPSTTPIDLSGTWTGPLTIQGLPAQMSWTVAQSGESSENGSIVIAMTDGTVLLNGMLTGTLSGSSLTFSIIVGAGAIPLLPSCTGEIDGTATATTAASSTLNGTLTVTTSTCPSPVSNGPFTLTKTD